MMYTDFCTNDSQRDMENSEASGRQAEMQIVPADAEVSGRQEMPAEVPAEAETLDRQEVQAEAPAEAEVPANPEADAQTPVDAEQEAPADGLQNDRQNLPAEGPQGQSPEVAGVVASAEDRGGTSAGAQAAPAGSAARFLPPMRTKPQMVNVTMRMTPDAKARAARLAHARGMSLSEFCAAVIDNVVREAGEEQAA